MKVVGSGVGGGFRISDEAWARYNELRAARGRPAVPHVRRPLGEQEKVLRCDADFVRVVEELGVRAHAHGHLLTIETIDDDHYVAGLWSFREYDDATHVELNERAIELWQELRAAHAREQAILTLLRRARATLRCERECCASAEPASDAIAWLEAHLNALERAEARRSAGTKRRGAAMADNDVEKEPAT